MRHLEERFCLSHASPLNQLPLLDIISCLGDKEGADQVPDGTFTPPPGTDSVTCAILELPQCPDQATQDFSVAVSPEEHQKHWKRAKEDTSSSMSGPHFGHWKAATDSKSLSEVHAVMSSVAAVVRCRYQLAFLSPGIYPAIVASRSLLRPRPNFR